MPEDFREFFAKLSENARNGLERAGSIASSYGSPYIGTEHILLGILTQGSSSAAKFLAENGITIQAAEYSLNSTPKTLALSDSGIKGMSETSKLALRVSWEFARGYNQNYLGTEHILLGILSQKNSRATTLLRDMGVDVIAVMKSLEGFIEKRILENGLNDRKKSIREGVMYKFGTDLVQKAKAGKIDPVIGRSTEISRIITILNRRTKNNPLLVGEPGVGKTAVVEALAQAIFRHEVPESLFDHKIIHVDLMSMISGTKYRGEFEERLKRLLDEVKQDSKVILFIDEIHLITGAGASEGSLDLANMIKPALSRGEIRLIGATTFKEAKKSIEKDSALSRRFQKISISEPTKTETIEIIKGLRESYEKHHSVKISWEIIEQTVDLADRYISGRFFPDKALDVLDEASSYARMSVKLTKKDLELRDKKRELEGKIQEFEDSEVDNSFEDLKSELDKLKEKITKRIKTVEIQDEHLWQAINSMTGIPVNRMSSGEMNVLVNFEDKLKKDIFGQDEIINAVSKTLKRNFLGISDQNKPMGSFVFLGPTGVGKTELVKSIAKELYGDEKSLLRFDMSEFSEKHTVSRLLGAPAGYVGFEDGGQLTEKVKQKPYSVVLFDEMEKAHPSVFNMLLQILDNGEVSDASGQTIDFRHTVIILTGNIGSHIKVKNSDLGFSAGNFDKKDDKKYQNLIRSEFEKFMKPELRGRFDEILIFNKLNEEGALNIVKKYSEELKLRVLKQYGVRLRITNSVLKEIVKRSFDDKNGARKLKKAVQNTIEHEIAEALIYGKIKEDANVAVRFKKGKVFVE